MISNWDLVSLIFIYQLTVKAENISKESVSCFEIELYQRLGLTTYLFPRDLNTEQRTSIKSQLFQSGANEIAQEIINSWNSPYIYFTRDV